MTGILAAGTVLLVALSYFAYREDVAATERLACLAARQADVALAEFSAPAIVDAGEEYEQYRSDLTAALNREFAKCRP